MSLTHPTKPCQLRKSCILERTPVYSHVWQKGDIIFWDNSQVMHRGIPYDATKYKRIALRWCNCLISAKVIYF
ncbi:TauD/TfdA family dioxygenase [Cylindrospermum sp. FACHB-282]|nr:TauD/TfdA family dioxygenase [Cylindrospermum sp. FACHB-282]